MEINFKYREHLKEYSVEENGFYYYMPYTFVLRLQDHCKAINDPVEHPVESWYIGLSDLERRVISKKSKDEEKLSSLW